MEILVIRHVRFEDVGHIGPVLRSRGIGIRYLDIGAQADYTPDVAGLVLMGGPMSVNDPDPWVKSEIQVVEGAIERGIPVLGICLGAQLVAKALGARIFANRVKEIGWFPVEWQADGQTDPLLKGLAEPETIFHWHGETFDLPAGARWLASSERCAHQAFRYGKNVHGFQFHLEVTPEMIEGWVNEDANCGDVRELSEPIDPHQNSKRLRELANLIFGRWADTLTSS
jgi:GMP synthase (glutamine-hydrolysing)